MIADTNAFIFGDEPDTCDDCGGSERRVIVITDPFGRPLATVCEPCHDKRYEAWRAGILDPLRAGPFRSSRELH